MSLIKVVIDTNAAVTRFYEVEVDITSFSIDFDFASIAGSPTYSVYVSNVSGDQSVYKTFDSAMIGVNIQDSVEIVNCNYRYIGILYTHNLATGVYSCFLNSNP